MSKIRKCINCKNGTRVEVVEDHTTTLEYDNISYEVFVPQLPLIQCSNKCGWSIYPDESFELLIDQLGIKADIITPNRIAILVDRIGETEILKQLDIPKTTLERYKSGGQIPLKKMNEKLKFLEANF